MCTMEQLHSNQPSIHEITLYTKNLQQQISQKSSAAWIILSAKPEMLQGLQCPFYWSVRLSTILDQTKIPFFAEITIKDIHPSSMMISRDFHDLTFLLSGSRNASGHLHTQLIDSYLPVFMSIGCLSITELLVEVSVFNYAGSYSLI